MCVCVCVCLCVRACVCDCVIVYVLRGRGQGRLLCLPAMQADHLCTVITHNGRLLLFVSLLRFPADTRGQGRVFAANHQQAGNLRGKGLQCCRAREERGCVSVNFCLFVFVCPSHCASHAARGGGGEMVGAVEAFADGDNACTAPVLSSAPPFPLSLTFVPPTAHPGAHCAA